MPLLDERQTRQISDEKAEAMEKFSAGLLNDLLLWSHACYKTNHGAISTRNHQLNFADILNDMEIDDFKEQMNIYALFRNLHFKPHNLSLQDNLKISGINTQVEIVIDDICKDVFK